MLARLLVPVAKLCFATVWAEAWPALPFRRCRGLRSSLGTSDVGSNFPAQPEIAQFDDSRPADNCPVQSHSILHFLLPLFQ